MNIFQISCFLVFENNKSVSFYLLRDVRTSVELTSLGSQDLSAKKYKKEYCGGKSQMDNIYLLLFIIQECRLGRTPPQLFQGSGDFSKTKASRPLKPTFRDYTTSLLPPSVHVVKGYMWDVSQV